MTRKKSSASDSGLSGVPGLLAGAKPDRMPRFDGLTGERGLLTAVIATAVADATGANPRRASEALDYFAGPVFRDHVTWLGLAEDARPVALEGENVSK